MANFKPIRSEGDYEVALHRISELMDTEADSPEGDELNVLVDLVKLYESKQVPMGYPSPVAALRSRKFSPASAQSPCRWRALHEHLGIPADGYCRSRMSTWTIRGPTWSGAGLPSSQWQSWAGFRIDPI